jgi:hypothetical protein
VKKLKNVLNEIYKAKDEARKDKEELWFIEEIWNGFAMIRPEIKAPEIDDLDKVSFENILNWDLEIGGVVKYVI